MKKIVAIVIAAVLAVSTAVLGVSLSDVQQARKTAETERDALSLQVDELTAQLGALDQSAKDAAAASDRICVSVKFPQIIAFYPFIFLSPERI